MRQHIEYLQAELACYREGGASDDIQVIILLSTVNFCGDDDGQGIITEYKMST